MIVTYDQTSQEKLTAKTQAITAAINSRLQMNDNVTNIQLFPFLQGALPDTNLNTQPVPMNFQKLVFQFKSKNDPANMRPLMGILGTADNSDKRQLGFATSSLQEFDLTDITSISEVTTVFSHAVLEKTNPKYHNRIVALCFKYNTSQSQDTYAVITSPNGPLAGSSSKDALLTKANTYNGASQDYKLANFTMDLNLFLKVEDGQNTLNASLLNVAASIIQGSSYPYFSNLSFTSAIPMTGSTIVPQTPTKIQFNLPFLFRQLEAKDSAKNAYDNYGSYEITSNSSSTTKKLEISQKNSSFTISIPSVSVTAASGAGVGVGSPFSYTKGKSSQTQNEASETQGSSLKTTLPVPRVCYHAVDFGSKDPSEAQANIQISTANGHTQIIVPLYTQVLEATTPDELTDQIIARI